MKVTDYIENKINKLAKGYVFTYNDFIAEADKKEAIIKALNRMVASGKIAKLSKGRYYKPEETVFGTLQPEQRQIVKDLLEDNGITTGYITGYSVYNRLGLTTQISNVIQIGKNETRPAFKRERYNIRFVKQKNKITKENVPLLQILDAFRFIKKIPDCSPILAVKRLSAILKDFNSSDLQNIVKLAAKYPPSTRALLGAVLENISEAEITEPLKASLNPITKYKGYGLQKELPTAEKWNII